MLYDPSMINFRFILTLLTMIALAYGILEVQSYLDTNFIDNETPIKHALNEFLNGNNPLKN